MPEIRHFIVTQTRSVKVDANNATDAVRLASAAFEHGQNADFGIARDKGPEGIWGNTSSQIKEESLHCERTTL